MIYVMDMVFEDESKVPDFGSIELVQSNVPIKDYLLKSKDIDKLNTITNADVGSTAYCTDTGDWYIYHQKEWVKQ